jgi:hypothetical protein
VVYEIYPDAAKVKAAAHLLVSSSIRIQELKKRMGVDITSASSMSMLGADA